MHPGSFQGTRLDRPVLDLSPVAEADGMNHPTLEAKGSKVRKSDPAAGAGDEKARQREPTGFSLFWPPQPLGGG